MNEQIPNADDEIGVLLRLHDELDEASDAMTAQAIASSFKPPMDALKVEIALAQLLVRGWIITTMVAPQKAYKISRAGILEVEKVHGISTTVDPGTGMIYRSYQARADSPKAVSGSAFDWTKWGTIIGGLALIATIIIAVIH